MVLPQPAVPAGCPAMLAALGCYPADMPALACVVRSVVPWRLCVWTPPVWPKHQTRSGTWWVPRMWRVCLQLYGWWHCPALLFGLCSLQGVACQNCIFVHGPWPLGFAYQLGEGLPGKLVRALARCKDPACLPSCLHPSIHAAAGCRPGDAAQPF